MYQRITAENPYEVPMRIYPAVHYTMGGLWVDYDLQTTIPGLFAIGEANFSDHGANRLGASALMQGLSDGYFVLPPVLNNYIAQGGIKDIDPTDAAVAEVGESAQARIDKLLSINGNRTVDSFHKELGLLVWEYCGMSRNEGGLRKALERIPELRKEFWSNVKVTGTGEELNQQLEKANRVADFLEFGELMMLDALVREESCGGHFREEHQTADGEAERDDENFSYVAAWEYAGETDDHDMAGPVLHKEDLVFEHVHLAQRSYA
jgi:succinate dehydrogenase / fumarate reductase flavoprotein subunit